MDSLKVVMEGLRKGDWTCSLDLKDAYLHIPMLHAHKKFLRFALGPGTLPISMPVFWARTGTQNVYQSGGSVRRNVEKVVGSNIPIFGRLAKCSQNQTGAHKDERGNPTVGPRGRVHNNLEKITSNSSEGVCLFRRGVRPEQGFCSGVRGKMCPARAGHTCSDEGVSDVSRGDAVVVGTHGILYRDWQVDQASYETDPNA